MKKLGPQPAATRLCHASRPVQASCPRSFHHHSHRSLAPRLAFLNLQISTVLITSLRTRRWPSSYAVPSRSRRPCDTQQRLLKRPYASSTSRRSNKPHRSRRKHNPSSTAIEMHFSWPSNATIPRRPLRRFLQPAETYANDSSTAPVSSVALSSPST